MTVLWHRALVHRLAVTAESSRPWPDRPVAVALVITDLDVGGAERALVMLATRLEPRRWRPGVFCLGAPGQLVEVLRQADVPCECLGVYRRNPVQAIARLARRCGESGRNWCKASCSTLTWRRDLQHPGPVDLGWWAVSASPSIKNGGT